METPLRKSIPLEIFDYQQAMSALSGYRSPRAHLTRLMREGRVVRIRKGLYVFGVELRRKALTPELLANLVYGPSYLSLEYALSYHDMIPERVAGFTSVSIGRSRSFDTPLGRFDYTRIPTAAFCLGFTRIGQGEDSFLIALPEKALADKVATDRQGTLRSRRAMREHLLENLRIEMTALCRLSPEIMDDIAASYHSRNVSVLSETIRELGKSRTRIS
jgi:hypothetical protein